MVDAAEFNRQLRSEFTPGLTIEQRDWPTIYLPREKEHSHLMQFGDTGTGKSALNKQLLAQIRRRVGERVIVYDKAREYLPLFYRPDLSDVIVDAFDDRCPYIELSKEALGPEEAHAIAEALYPENEKNPRDFFVEAPRQILEELLAQRPSMAELIAWIASDEALDRQLAGTIPAGHISRKVEKQRQSVLSALRLNAKVLEYLPREPRPSGRSWNASTWAKEGKGWVFIASRPETHALQVPLITLFIDLLIQRLLALENPSTTWLFLGEVASLNKIPQLAAAVTQGRKPRIAIVLECQNQAQIQTLYGYNAPTILSQPYTKFMLATSDPKSAKWLEEAIGEEETDRIRESRSVGGRSSATENLDRHTDPLVMRSQIENLSDLNGYLKVRGLPVVPIQIRYPNLEPTQPAFIRRTLDRELIQLTAPPMMPPPPTKPAGRGFTVVR